MARNLPAVLTFLLLALLVLGGFASPLSVTASPQTGVASKTASAPSTVPTLPSLPSFSSSFRGTEAPTIKTLWQKVEDPNQTPGNFLYYTPAEVREAYNATSLLSAGYTGQGYTISIVDAYGAADIQGDLNNFSKEFGLPMTSINIVHVDGPGNLTAGVLGNWNGEIALDVEWAHAMAPQATINLYIASNASAALFDAVEWAVNDYTGPHNSTTVPPSSVISMSWGNPENDFGWSAAVQGNYPWLDAVLQEAAAKGITVFASSGDDGAYDLAQPLLYGGASYPSTDPYVTGVGGTSLYLSTTSGSLQNISEGATGGYGYETAWSWNDFYGWGTGGGFSTMFSQPAWQTGPGVRTGVGRGAPDVAWDADVQTGVVVYVDGGFYIVGGTSVGSPSWAGSIALIDQKAGHTLGFINPALYSILDNPKEYAKAFHDVTVGNNDPYSAGKGWDALTGLGSPNLGELSDFLVSSSAALAVSASSSVGIGYSSGYGDTVTIQAKVLEGATSVTTGTGSASITASDGEHLGTVGMTYDSVTGYWTGTYTVEPTNPPGMWTATVHVVDGADSGTGSTTFSVGDGVNIYEPYIGPGAFFEVGDTIPITAVITAPDGTTNVTSGDFNAVLSLGTRSGALEGVVKLSYDSLKEVWEGSFVINSSRDQGAWVLSVQGTDSSGNQASPAYSWLEVGLALVPADIGTSEPTYLLGNTMEIFAFTNTTTGSLGATINDTTNGAPIGTTALSSIGHGFWEGSFSIGKTDPPGFYGIVLTGTDHSGNFGTAETVVRVAPLSLRLTTHVSATSLPATSKATVEVTAAAKYPNGTALKVGTVEGSVSATLENGTTISLNPIPMTYQSAAGKFTGSVQIPIGPGSLKFAGTYTVTVGAFDPLGNFRGGAASFTVKGVQTKTKITCGSSGASVGSTVTCTAEVIGLSPAGTVLWLQGGSGSVSFSSASCTLDASGECGVTVTGAAAGPVLLIASYQGYGGDLSSAGTHPFAVVSIAVSCTSPATEGTATPCEVIVVGASPTGEVTWSTSGTGTFSSHSCTLRRGECTVRYTPTSAGSPVTITATYAGNRNNPSVLGTYSLTVS